MYRFAISVGAASALVSEEQFLEQLMRAFEERQWTAVNECPASISQVLAKGGHDLVGQIKAAAEQMNSELVTQGFLHNYIPQI